MTTIDYKYVFGTFEEIDVTDRLIGSEFCEELLKHIQENDLMDEIIYYAVEDMREWVMWAAGDAMWDALDVGVFETTGKHIRDWEDDADV